MSAAAVKKFITLTSSDGESFQVEEAVAMQSQKIKRMIEAGGTDNGIPVANVTGAILAKVIEYCEKHQEAPKPDDGGLENWDADFAKVDRDTIFDLILAADHLGIRDLLDLTCRTAADVMNGKSPEEEEGIHGENRWAFA